MNKKLLNIILLIVGITLIAFSILFLKDDAVKTYNGVCLGLGTGLLAISVSNLAILNRYKKHPDELKQSEIDYKDERNQIIRNKAKAMCSDIIQWCVMIAAWITIFAGFPLWITLTLVGIFLLKNILELYLISKYNKEM